MSDRETRSFKTPSGHEIVIKSWLTGREKRDIQNIYLTDVKISSDQTKAPELNLDATKSNLAQDKTFELMVISIDGKTDNIVDTILDMKSEDFDVIVAKLNSITTGAEDKETKKD